MSKRYLALAGFFFLFAIAAAAAVNLYVDPYRLYRPGGAQDHASKPRASQQSRLLKIYAVARAAPQTLLLGNSRVEVGLDPRSSSWPADSAPVFNAGIPGGDLEDSLAMLQHALAHGKPRRVVVGLDFQDFLVDPDVALPDDGWTAGPRDLATLPERIRAVPATVLSLDALFDSLATLARRNDASAPDIRSDGLNPLAEYPGLARREGYGVLFRQRDEENAKAYARMPHAIYRSGEHTSRAWRTLDRLIGVAKAEQIELAFVIYPYHAHLLELIRIRGLWPQFEEWKHGLVDVIEAAAKHGAAAVLWDFSGYSAYAIERVPPVGDRSSGVAWYWEAGHFKRALGDRVLERMFGGGDDSFGERLNEQNVAAHVERIRRERERYAQSEPATIAEMLAIAKRSAR